MKLLTFTQHKHCSAAPSQGLLGLSPSTSSISWISPRTLSMVFRNLNIEKILGMNVSDQHWVVCDVPLCVVLAEAEGRFELQHVVVRSISLEKDLLLAKPASSVLK